MTPAPLLTRSELDALELARHLLERAGWRNTAATVAMLRGRALEWAPSRLNLGA